MAERAFSALIALISKLGSSHHAKHFPGENMTPSQITCGEGNNILHVAAKYRKSSDVEIILNSHPFLMQEANAKGDTALHIAARLGKLDVVTCIVEYVKGLAVEAEYRKLLRMVNNKRNTALHEAVLNGRGGVAELLITEEPVLTTLGNEAGESPLFLAIDGGYEKIALRILETFPRCSISGRNGMTAMHAAVIRAQSRKIGISLLGGLQGGTVDVVYMMGKMIVSMVCMMGEMIIDWIINHIWNHHEDSFVGNLLTKCGPQILDIPDEFGWMPHHYAAKLGFSRVLKRILEIDSSLAYIKDKEGMSALHISVKNGRTNVVKILIERCPDVCELLNNRGRTALHVAVEHKQVFALHTFLNMVAFDDLLNEQDHEGNTALHLACIDGHYKMIGPLLVDPRTNKRIINKKGMTFFDIMNQSSVLGPLDKVMITSEWRTKYPDSLLNATSVWDTKERQKKSSAKQEALSAEKGTEDPKDQTRTRTADVNLLVATIIASITFTAAMTMPGGFNGSTGLAQLRKEASFRYFLVFDSLAFGCSAASMALHFAVGVHRKLRGKTYKYPIQLTTSLTLLSITSTMLAFVMGTYTVLYEKKLGGIDFGLPGNIAVSAFLITLLYLFMPLVIAFIGWTVTLAPASESRALFANVLSKLLSFGPSVNSRSL